ncbi:MAG: hypothetical protein WCZ23_11665 [Rhodospirillaceae bacterium]
MADDDDQAASDLAAWQARVAGANINAQTLLATDYLNHFNEIVMLLGMVPDMPDILGECKEWAPKSYQDHFRDSSFRDKELAVDAYDHVPQRFRQPFEETISHMNDLVAQSIDRLEDALAQDDADLLRGRAHAASHAIQRLMDFASAIIHGNDRAMDQDAIDTLMGF